MSWINIRQQIYELYPNRKAATKGGSLPEILNCAKLHSQFPNPMLLTASELSREQPAGSWFCLRAQPKREHIAAVCLRQISEVEAFCPKVRYRKRTNRGSVWFVEPMFPGYLFARFDYEIFHRRVRHRPAITGFVQFGDRLALLPHALIKEIRSQTDDQELLEIDQGLKPGQNIQIAHGPFQGLEGLVTRLIAARDRVEILIEWMGRNLHAEASAADLVPLTEPRFEVTTSRLTLQDASGQSLSEN